MVIPEGALPLAVGTLLAIIALGFVLSPLVFGVGPEPLQGDDSETRLGTSRFANENQGSAIVALREIEFDRETGKLSDADYIDLKQRYTRAAIDELRAADASARTVDAAEKIAIDNAVEEAIERARLAQRSCPSCGPRPEPDSVYCSNCGRFLGGSCRKCGASIDIEESRFCSNCGEQIEAA